MSDIDFLRELLDFHHDSNLWQHEAFRMQLLRYWDEELAKPRHADPKRLLRHGFKVFSQNDEDGIIQEIFRRIGTLDRRFVEFGVDRGFECNTAKLLIEGWQGLWIEGDARAVTQMRERFAPFLAERKLALAQGRVTADNINAILESAGVTGEIDILSIDIDGNDYWIWKAIDVVRPRVVIIEYK